MKLNWKIGASPIFFGVIFIAILAATVSAAPAGQAVSDDCWTTMNSGDFAGTNGPVYAQVWHDGYLYVGGRFTVAGNIPCNNIARWDGTMWDSLGPGTDSTISALAVRDSTLFAGGPFGMAGNTCSPFIAQANIRRISAGINQFPSAPSTTARFRYSRRILRISDVAALDRIELYMLSGKIIRRAIGAACIDLKNIPPQTVVFRVVRGTRMITQAVVVVAE